MNKTTTKGMHHEMFGMQMFFFLSENVTLFFKEWITKNSVGKLTGACIGLIIIAIFYEGLKVGRRYLITRHYRPPPTVITNLQVNGTKIEEVKDHPTPSRDRRLALHLIQTLLHMVQIFVGYMLMLAFMSYNVWICLAVLFGAGLGYFIFGGITLRDQMDGEHCN